MIHQRDDVQRHLLDGVDALRGNRAAAAARIVKNNVKRLAQRQPRRFPHLAGKGGGRHEDQRLALAVGLVVKIDTRREFNVRHKFLPFEGKHRQIEVCRRCPSLLPRIAPSPSTGEGRDRGVNPELETRNYSFANQHTAAISLSSRRNFVHDAPPSSLRSRPPYRLPPPS